MSCDPCATRSVANPTGATSATCQPGPRGPRGASGSGGAAGTNGLHAYTLTSANFTMPAVGASVSVSVGNGSWIGAGQIIYVEGAGYFSASSPAATSVTLSNLGYGPNVAESTVIESGAVVSPGAPKGANAPDDTRGYVLLRRELAPGTDGGTLTSGSWIDRLINTVAQDTQGQVVTPPALGVFQIKAGKYKVRAEVPAFDVNRHRARLMNVTTGAFYYGTSEFTGDNGQTSSLVLTSLDLDVDTEFKLQTRCQVTKATTGMGNAADFGVNEVYEFIEFTEVP